MKENQTSTPYHFGETLQWVLDQKGLSKQAALELLKDSGIADTILTRPDTPQIKELKRICDVLNIRCSFFLFKQEKSARTDANKGEASGLKTLWLEKSQIVVDENNFQKPAAPKQNAP